MASQKMALSERQVSGTLGRTRNGRSVGANGGLDSRTRSGWNFVAEKGDEPKVPHLHR